MSDAPSDGPDARRALLAVVAVLALVTSAAAAPVLAGQTPLADVDSPSAPSDVPGFLRGFEPLRDLLDRNQQPRVEGTSGLGALRLGDATDVGGPVSQEAQRDAATPHFVGRTDGPTYWRTGAYVDYTGNGWERSDVNTIQPGRLSGERERETHDVVLRRPATALPTPWRPIGVNHDCPDGETCGVSVSATDTTGIRATPALGAGGEYALETLSPVSDPSLLREVRVRGSIASTQYTSIDTTDRMEQLAARVVGDADNRYDAAKAVEEYLEAEKTYSLTDVPKPGDSVADQFVFEQENGYCENFATAMTVMLRSQDVPARYVVGYTAGERVGEDRYLVRGADAHAWVEVYFENYGWVRFDPTPTAPRQAADERLAEGSPTYRISVNESLVPGETVTTEVTTAGTPASNAAVFVNGERVATTDEDGLAQFRVPYADSVNVTVRPVDDDGHELTPVDDNATAALGFGVAAAQTDQSTTNETGTTREFDVAANVRFQFDGDVEAGDDLPVSVTIEGREFANASVSVAGEPQGRTGPNGTIPVTIPPDASGVVELTASRGNLTRTTTYPLDDLSVSVSPSLVAPFPSTKATARVTSGGEAVTGAPVTLNGETVGFTDENGKIRFDVPLSRTPSVAATASGKEATTYVDGVLPSLALGVLAAVGSLAGVAAVARRRGITLAGVIAGVRYAVREVASGVVEALVGVADAMDDLVAEFRAAADEGWREVLSWLASLPGRARLPDVRAWLAGIAAAAREASRDDIEDAAENADRGRLASLWRRFVAVVGVRDWRTKTPAEVAREAVGRGFPERPVYALTTAFRDAAYGGSDEDARAEEAERALDSLQSDDEEEGEQ
ncbi:transglutaminase domain-containing protein [Halobacterium litoreum]|uniref:Transglutaminase domain-containing protein n=1 Tax=Halobacterium litoreum TaxID=2039234 RepID=A0ABD5NC49_9EURY|nr:transglutaminase domain-containing protein [Halobacterium litoreum]UHH14360.1 hypothetical protein LT972_05010 [Halobacterium litoreum]